MTLLRSWRTKMASWTADDDEDDGKTWDLFTLCFSLPYIYFPSLASPRYRLLSIFLASEDKMRLV